MLPRSAIICRDGRDVILQIVSTSPVIMHKITGAEHAWMQSFG